jgi:hypothetical protein
MSLTSTLSHLADGQFIATSKTGNYTPLPQTLIESIPSTSEIEAVRNIAAVSAHSIFGNFARPSQEIELIKIGGPRYLDPSRPHVRDSNDAHSVNGKKYEIELQEYAIVLDGVDPRYMNRNNPELKFEVYRKASANA